MLQIFNTFNLYRKNNWEEKLPLNIYSTLLTCSLTHGKLRTTELTVVVEVGQPKCTNKVGQTSITVEFRRIMSSRSHRCKQVSWCLEPSLPETATPDPDPNNRILPQVHMSPPQACGGAPDEEDLKKQSTDQSGFGPQNACLHRSSPVISRRCRHGFCSGATLAEVPDGPIGGTLNNHMALIKMGCACRGLATRLHLLVGGKFRLAEKKHIEGRVGRCSAQWEMEKENAHLLMVDLVLEMLEVIQWNLTNTKRTSPRPQRPSSKQGKHRDDETVDDRQDQHRYTPIYSEAVMVRLTPRISPYSGKLSALPDSCYWTSGGGGFPPSTLHCDTGGN
ncbi:uncharacterized protein LOC133511928 isoform X2 [Syngnathoides biaculeatus]|uniref:uncharacterized protein LOC133511928 isoform X2 n=1 Tax=Syngnathoides biaculeatus TaxID=300417 RepID=UPI002ADD895D|nr:uncharacterized protein LOC133511928 isoform X2 [Syngnathoides biaculeatus]